MHFESCAHATTKDVKMHIANQYITSCKSSIRKHAFYSASRVMFMLKKTHCYHITMLQWQPMEIAQYTLALQHPLIF